MVGRFLQARRLKVEGLGFEFGVWGLGFGVLGLEVGADD